MYDGGEERTWCARKVFVAGAADAIGAVVGDGEVGEGDGAGADGCEKCQSVFAVFGKCAVFYS